jgi:hypothetical protein
MSKQSIRFLRSEIIARWPIDPDQIGFLDGSRYQLVALLRENFEFSQRRALAEVDEFLSDFDARLRSATQVIVDLRASPSAA